MRKIITTGLILFSTTVLFAEDVKDLNTALKVSTLGVGLDISTPINDTFSARFNVNGAAYSKNETSNGNSYSGTLTLFTAGVLLDTYPFENKFRLSTGIYYNGNNFTGTAIDKVTINGTTYNISDIGKVDADITFNKIAPYIGIGWGNTTKDKGWGFTFDLGALYHGKGEVDLTSERGNSPRINEGLAKEEVKINDELADNKIYPVVALGVNYTF